ncbi:MAG: beta-galactosidase, partial [Sedimentisphaerales bacterium]
MDSDCTLVRFRLLVGLMLIFLMGQRVSVAAGEVPHLVKKGTAVQLVVDDDPLVMLAGELHNSSSTGLEYMERLWPKLKRLNLNTVIAAVSWELVEPEEGHFDFELVDGIMEQAREHDMHVVLLWFASWKNGVSSYAPAWVKKDTRRFPRCLGASNLNTKDVLTPLSEENQRADARAFAALMSHLRQTDGERHTVIMVQVENEVGIRPEPRDLSPLADRAYAAAVPAALMDYLTANKDSLIPELRDCWAKTGFRRSGSWTEVFGEGVQTDEIFSAWYYAKYIGGVVKAGKAEYPLPMSVNAWLRAPEGKPGDYPSGGPVAHVMDIWRAAAPDIDLYAPDIYLPDFKGICAE